MSPRLAVRSGPSSFAEGRVLPATCADERQRPTANESQGTCNRAVPGSSPGAGSQHPAPFRLPWRWRVLLTRRGHRPRAHVTDRVRLCRLGHRRRTSRPGRGSRLVGSTLAEHRVSRELYWPQCRRRSRTDTVSPPARGGWRDIVRDAKWCQPAGFQVAGPAASDHWILGARPRARMSLAPELQQHRVGRAAWIRSICSMMSRVLLAAVMKAPGQVGDGGRPQSVSHRATTACRNGFPGSSRRSARPHPGGSAIGLLTGP